MYTTGEDTLDPNDFEFELPIGIKAATEEEITAYYASLNMNTSKSKDIFPERSLQEQKRMFDREAREQRKQLSKRSRKSRSVVLPGEPPEEPMVYLYGEYPSTSTSSAPTTQLDISPDLHTIDQESHIDFGTYHPASL